MIDIKTDKKLQLIKVDYVNRLDKIIITYKEVESGKKFQHIISEPKVNYYYRDLNLEDTERLTYSKKDDLKKITVKYSSMIDDIVERLNNPKVSRFYQELISTGNKYNLRLIHALDYRLFSSDINIQDYYTSQFINQFHDDETIYNITKGFFDIEVDTYENQYMGFPREDIAPCRINLITYYNKETHSLYIYALDNGQNESLTNFRDNLSTKGVKFKKSLIKYFKKYNLHLPEDFKVYFKFYDNNELALIMGFLNNKNEHRLDILSGWNIKFDIITIQNRLLQHIHSECQFAKNYMYQNEMNRLFCGKKCKVKNSYFYVDVRSKDAADSGSYFSSTDYSLYLDQMIVYCALRKQLGKEESETLEYISNKVLKVGKVKFKGKENIRNLAYLNYFKFVKYGAIDTLLLHFMEEKNDDLGQIYSLSLTTHTRPCKALKKTISLRNLYAEYLRKQNLIISNNLNVSNTTKEKFRGGYVCDPLLNSNNGEVIEI